MGYFVNGVSRMGDLNNIERGNRIRAERLRLGLSQKDFAALFGKKTMASLRYEKGERVMGHDDLEALYNAGVDVWFLLTGKRTDLNLLTDEKNELLNLWDSIDLDHQRLLMILIKKIAESSNKK